MSRQKNNLHVITLLLLLFSFCSSCETDKSRIDKCKEVVKSFTSNISLENAIVLKKLYPTFSKIKTYWKIADFRIENSTIDKDRTVSVVGNSSQGKILFILKKVDGDYVIAESKGLSSQYDSYLYNYCKRIGCISSDMYDAQISEICDGKSYEFQTLVQRMKSDIEEKFVLENHTLNISGGGYIDPYVVGNITMKNYSRFSIPAGCYQIYYRFTDDLGNLLFTANARNSYRSIGYGQSITDYIMQDSHGFKKIKVELRLTSTDFIEKAISQNITGNNCSANEL